MNKKVIVIGAGGHGRVIADIIVANGDSFVGFLDDNINKLPIGKTDEWGKYKDYEFIIGIGDNAIREQFSRQIANVNWYTAIHPSAVVSPNAKVGKGTVVMPNAVINSGADVGAHCIINSGAIVEHDNVINDFCHISVGVKLGGTVHIGKNTFVGIGTVVSNNTNICDDCILGAGTVVVKDINELGKYIGVPARRVE